MKNKHIQRDPHAERESTKYENPIPSREYILDQLRESVGPLTHGELCSELGLADDAAVEALRRRLSAMERDGQVVRNRRGAYGTLDKMNLIKGRVIGHPEGFGFVDSGSDQDVYLSSRQMRRVFDGDEVLVRVTGWDRRGRPEGSIVEVVEHRTAELVGRYFVESGVHFVRPDNPRISQDVVIPSGENAGAGRGQIVVVEIASQPSRQNLPAGRILRVLGEHRAPGMEIDIALYNYGIPHVWPVAVENETAAIAEEVLAEDKRNRVDLRALPLVTIDGEDARDFDDAVYCEPLRRGGWRLYVAIADVSHYVQPGSALDTEAYNRGNSVYFPEQVVPMLPEKLSNGLCSLNPEVDRLCMVCEMTIGRNGEVGKFQFYEGVMHSRARLTYTQVAGMIAGRGDPRSGVRKRFHEVVPHIDNLYDLYRLLRDARERRGAIDFETGETRILFDSQRKIQQIIPVQRTDAHKLIEECMLSANVCAARLLEKSQLPALYRIHEGPGEEKLAGLREFLGELGLGLPGGDDPSPMDYQSVLQKIEDRPDSQIIQSVMLRSMSRARYDADNQGHFGLNYDTYTHFTSPIRRYPDLLVHRAIRSLIRGRKRVAHVRRIQGAPAIPRKDIYPYDHAWIDQAGAHSSTTERRADDATRDVVNWLKCEYLLDKVGDEFQGVVTAVTGFGLFVELNELFIEGLVHITGLPKDYYFHEPVHHRLVGERTRRVFRLGDPLRVRISRVDLDERKIDFDLVEAQKRKGRKGDVKVSPKAMELAREFAENSEKKRGAKAKKSSPGKSAAGTAGAGKGKPARNKAKGETARSKPAKSKPAKSKPPRSRTGRKKPRSG